MAHSDMKDGRSLRAEADTVASRSLFKMPFLDRRESLGLDHLACKRPRTFSTDSSVGPLSVVKHTNGDGFAHDRRESLYTEQPIFRSRLFSTDSSAGPYTTPRSSVVDKSYLERRESVYVEPLEIKSSRAPSTDSTYGSISGSVRGSLSHYKAPLYDRDRHDSTFSERYDLKQDRMSSIDSGYHAGTSFDFGASRSVQERKDSDRGDSDARLASIDAAFQPVPDASRNENRPSIIPTTPDDLPKPLDSAGQKLPSIKELVCPHCSRVFLDNSQLKSHLRTHSEERPYHCPTCKQTFSRLHDLERHTMIHTGERPHVCEICGRRFARAYTMMRHKNGNNGCAGRRAESRGVRAVRPTVDIPEVPTKEVG